MKKTILSMLLIGSSCALFAQVDTTRTDTTQATLPETQQAPTDTMQTNMNQNNVNQNNVTVTTGDSAAANETLRTTGAYSAYGSVVSVPTNIQTSFQQNYPTAGDVKWEQNNQFYRASYTVGSRRMKTFYDMRGNTFSLALPVTQSLVPDDVIEKAYQLHGDNVYDIILQKGANDSLAIYQVRVIENGVVRSERMHADGSAVMPEELVNPVAKMLDSLENLKNMNNMQNPPMTDSMNNMNNNMSDTMQNNMNQTTDSTMHDNSGVMDNDSNKTDQPNNPNPDNQQSENKDAMKPDNKNELK